MLMVRAQTPAGIKPSSGGDLRSSFGEVAQPVRIAGLSETNSVVEHDDGVKKPCEVNEKRCRVILLKAWPFSAYRVYQDVGPLKW
jgi:hypothetical protein